MQNVASDILGLEESDAGTVDTGALVHLCNILLIASVELPIVRLWKIKGIGDDADLFVQHIWFVNPNHSLSSIVQSRMI